MSNLLGLFLCALAVWGLNTTSAAVTRQDSITCASGDAGTNEIFWQLQIVTDANGKLQKIEGLNGLDTNGGLDMRTASNMPLVHMAEYSRGYAFEMFDSDFEWCASFVNAATVNLWSQGGLGFLYLFALLYSFLGVSIIADVFMSAIEVITSQERQVTRIVADPESGNQQDVTIEVRIWNETVANLTLLALGSSAPEILLAVLETVTSLGEPAGELGPSTIVGSAAFNLFMISAICALSVPTGEERKLSQLGVFLITASSSVFAYVWMLICITAISPERIDLWEAFMTFLFFPILVGVAYAQDVDLFSVKDEDHQDRVRVELGFKEQIVRAVGDGDLEKVNKARVAQSVQKDLLGRKSPLWWRINGVRMMAGKKPMVRSGDQIEVVTSDDDEEDEKELQPLIGGQIFKKTKKGKELKRTCDTMISFTVPQFSAYEDEGKVLIPVHRTGNLDREHYVDYETLNGTAIAGDDFEYKEGTLKFQKGEEIKNIEIKINEDEEVEDNEFFSVMLMNPIGESIELGDKMTTVIIIDVSDPGEFKFMDSVVSASERSGKVRVEVRRVNGSTDRCTVDYTTRAGTANPGVDYGTLGEVGEVSGTLVFENQESSKVIEIPIINNNKYDAENRDFNIQLSNPTNKSRLVASSRAINIQITDDDHYTGIINDVFSLLRSGHDLQTHSWRQQFIDALAFESEAYVPMALHILSFPWKVAFACIPPTSYYNGWLTFGSSLSVIGAVTYVIGDLAATWGCFVGIEESIVALTVVALGTSMPDTFASITATQMAPDADAAIGNITGSNSVNVFLGLGLPWLIASIYAEANGEEYIVPKGTLSTSVMVFCPCALITLSIFVVREYMGIGALGGTAQGRKYMAMFFAFEWFFFILMAVLKSNGTI